jgi:penicillin-binding protein 1A
MSLARTLMSGISVLGLTGTLIIGSVGLSYIKNVDGTLPDHKVLNSWVPSEGTTIISSDGVLLGVHAKEHRKFVPLKEIPNVLISAFISAEDGNYWHHHGIDVVSITRAALSNLKSGPDTRLEGGSTITQQVVKNMLLTSERTLDRKIKEAILALKSDRDIGKNKILEIYLNQIYFGSGAYGVSVAAETYFGKDLSELSIAEAAMLAGLPKAPSAANPYTNPERALDRRNYVLRRMLENGYISEQEHKVAVSIPMNANKNSVNVATGDPSMWYAQEAVRRQILQSHGEKQLYEGGGDVVSTINSRIQKIVHAELRRHLVLEDRKSGWRGPLKTGYIGSIDWTSPLLAKPSGAEDWSVAVVLSANRDALLETENGEVSITGVSLSWATPKKHAASILKPGDVVLLADVLQGAVVVMNPNDGSVLGLAGGFSGETSEFDRATQAKRQTGSVFKPFVYMAAIEAGYNATSPVLDSPIAIDQGTGKRDWRPSGGSSGGLGMITFRRSLELSRNLSTVRLLYDLGMDRVVNLATRVGFKMPANASYAMALGATEATPMEVASAYSAFANGGYRVQPKLLSGDIEAQQRVFQPMDVAKITSILEGVVKAGTAQKAFSKFKHPLAGKTGTTNESRDAWFAAYGPDIVIVGWLGRDDDAPLYKGAAGGSSAAPLVRDILDDLDGLVPLNDFRIPAEAETVLVNRKTGAVDPDGDVLEVMSTDEIRQLTPSEPEKNVEDYVDSDQEFFDE